MQTLLRLWRQRIDQMELVGRPQARLDLAELCEELQAFVWLEAAEVDGAALARGADGAMREGRATWIELHQLRRASPARGALHRHAQRRHARAFRRHSAGDSVRRLSNNPDAAALVVAAIAARCGGNTAAIAVAATSGPAANIALGATETAVASAVVITALPTLAMTAAAGVFSRSSIANLTANASVVAARADAVGSLTLREGECALYKAHQRRIISHTPGRNSFHDETVQVLLRARAVTEEA
eukprot:4625825-Pleurochrysis_carterae.AAC.1